MSVLRAVNDNNGKRPADAISIDLVKRKIPANGDLLDLLDEASVNNALVRYKQHLKKRGFHCYALGRYLWIVPSVHKEIGVPDFQRAVELLPDFASELQDNLGVKQQKGSFTITPKMIGWIIGGLVVFSFLHNVL